MARWCLVVLALVACLLGAAFPQSAPAQWGIREYPVQASARFHPSDTRRGGTTSLIVEAAVNGDFHIYAMDLGFDGVGPTATEIELDADTPAVMEPTGPWQEPTPTMAQDEGFQALIGKHFQSPVVFRRSFLIPPTAVPGTYEIKGILYVQACTKVSCLPPTEIPWSAVLTIQEGAPVKAPVPPPAPEYSTETLAHPGLVDSAPTEPTPEGPWRFMLGSFLFGLLALLTPCVFPMIPITVSFFSNKAAKNARQAAKYAVIYVLSIIAGFTAIGFGVSLVLRALGAGVESSGFANMLASNPWVNIFFALLYFFFTLSLLEVVHLALPGGLANRLNLQATGRSDALGIMFKALVFVLISFTCTAPLVGVLMVQALGGEWTRPFLGMLAFSTGLALPFFVLALVPQMLGSLPRSGSWLYSVKVVMALLVLAAGFKFVSNADLVLLQHDMLFTREVLLAIWTTIAMVTAFYLFRWIRFEADGATTTVGAGRLLTGGTFLALGLYLAAGLFGSRLHVWIESYLPPDLDGAALATVAPGGTTPTAPVRDRTGGDYVSNGFTWFTEVEPAIAHAREMKLPLFIDFTGYSCTNCRLMERTMFPRADVAEAMEGYVRVKLYTDDRKLGADRRAFQARLFNTVSLPFYAIITPEEKILATEAYTTDPERFVRFLKLEG